MSEEDLGSPDFYDLGMRQRERDTKINNVLFIFLSFKSNCKVLYGDRESGFLLAPFTTPAGWKHSSELVQAPAVTGSPPPPPPQPKGNSEEPLSISLCVDIPQVTLGD